MIGPKIVYVESYMDAVEHDPPDEPHGIVSISSRSDVEPPAGASVPLAVVSGRVTAPDQTAWYEHPLRRACLRVRASALTYDDLRSGPPPAWLRSPARRGEHTLVVAHLVFDDLDRPPGPSYVSACGEPVLFSDAHAHAVCDLLWILAGEAPEYSLLVHCGAGVSRSPAVAAALAKHFRGDDSEYFRRYCPNRLVYRVMLDALARRHPVPCCGRESS